MPQPRGVPSLLGRWSPTAKKETRRENHENHDDYDFHGLGPFPDKTTPKPPPERDRGRT